MNSQHDRRSGEARREAMCHVGRSGRPGRLLGPRSVLLPVFWAGPAPCCLWNTAPATLKRARLFTPAFLAGVRSLSAESRLLYLCVPTPGTEKVFNMC